MHEDHLGLVGRVGVVTTLGSVTLPCLAARAHVRCHVLAGQGRPRPGRGLTTGWPLLAAVLLPHLATALLAATPAAGCLPGRPWAIGRLWPLPRGAAAAAAVAPCCVAVARLISARTWAGSLLPCAVTSA